MKKLLLLFNLVFITTIGFSQNPNHFIIGAEELANIDVYTIIQDSNEVLYIGTNRGVYAYKQNKFTALKYPKEIGNSFFRFEKNKNNELFCMNLKGQIFKIQQDSLVLFFELDKNVLGVKFDYYFDQKNRLITIAKNIQRITENKIEVLLHQDSISPIGNSGINFAFSNKTNKDEFFISVTGSDYNFLYKNGQLIKTKKISKEQYYQEIYINYIGNEQFEICYTKEIKFKNKDIETNQFIGKGIKYFCLSKSKYLELNRFQGAVTFTLKDNVLIKGKPLFEDKFLSSAYQNSEGTIFLGTFKEGIIVVPKIEVVSENYDYNFTTICAKNDKEVLLGTRNGSVLKYTGTLNLIDKLDIGLAKINHFPNDIKGFNNKERGIYYSKLTENAVYKDVCILNSESFLTATHSSIRLFSSAPTKFPTPLVTLNNLGKTIPPTKRLYTGRSRSVTYNFIDSTYYYSTNFGLFSGNFTSKISDTLTYKNQAIIGNDLVCYKDTLICGSENLGVLFYKKNKLIKELNITNRLKSNYIKKVLVKKDLLFILSLKGVQVWDLKLDKFLNTGINNGFVSTQNIIDIDITDEKIWLMTKNSFSSVNISTVYNEKEIGRLFFDSLVVNGVNQLINEKSNYTYSENSFTFYLDYRNIETKKETRIDYILEGFHKDWKTMPTDENSIEFELLPPGTYTLIAKASFENQSSNKFSYSFTINSPFWQKWWFYVLCLAFIASIIILFFRRKLKSQAQQSRLENELSASKLKTIQSQMNPHFIFNALNSIQYLVIKKETDNAYSYIARFANLIRKTLDFSEKETITIQQEIELLEVYLELEKLRFQDDFEYEIVKKNIKEVRLPPMLIQPFIENALVHGLLHKTGLKKLTISIEVMKDYISCIIDDNGVGRLKAKKIRNRQKGEHESFALNAINNRFNILNENSEHKLGYEYEDFPEGESEVSTRVVVNIPTK